MCCVTLKAGNNGMHAWVYFLRKMVYNTQSITSELLTQGTDGINAPFSHPFFFFWGGGEGRQLFFNDSTGQ